MANYDTQLFRVSSLQHLTAGLTTADDKYEEAKAKVEELTPKVDKYRLEYNTIVNKDTKTTIKKLQTLNNASEKLEVQQTFMNAFKANLGKIFLGDTAKTHLIDLRNGYEFNRTNDVKSKYLEKGLETKRWR